MAAAEQRARVVAKLHSLLKPFLLRRIKADVEIALPQKQELLLYAPMTKLQRQLNQQLLERTLAVSPGRALSRVRLCGMKGSGLFGRAPPAAAAGRRGTRPSGGGV
jgi:hypothetical protein